MNILSVKFTDQSAPKDFVESLRTTGFGVVSDHGITKELIEKVYREWADFFAGSAKHSYLFNPETQAGYFPFRSENAKDSPIKDLKEFYHIYPGFSLPSTLSPATQELYSSLMQVGSSLLRWLDENSPSEVRSLFSMPLAQMIERSEKNLFRIIHYPPLVGNEEAGAIRAAAHEDINLITLLPASTEMGLEVKGSKGEWIAVPGGFGDLVINVGDMLQEASGGFFKSTTHRVVNPKGEAAKRPRYSMPLFIHPRPEVRLSKQHTADSYLNERLKELGLKS